MRATLQALPAERADAHDVPDLHELLSRTSGELYRLAVRLTGNLSAADDVIQTAYLQAFEALRAGRFRGECRLETWLYRIVVRAASTERRTEDRRGALLALKAPPAPGPTSSELTVELRELEEALGTLPQDQRVALVLKELQGLTGREVAQVMEKTEGAVEQLLYRARSALKERFSR